MVIKKRNVTEPIPLGFYQFSKLSFAMRKHDTKRLCIDASICFRTRVC